jgi:hypothetical protein
MPGLTEIRGALNRYAVERGVRLEVSEVYDLFPSEPSQLSSGVAHHFPATWPRGDRHGVYLFFSAEAEPRFLYVGRASGKTVCIKARLDGYIDRKARRLRGECVLREEWNGYRRPWGTRPRYVITVAMPTDSATGKCPQADFLEQHLIHNLDPTENIQGRK